VKNSYGIVSGLMGFALISAILLGATLAVGHVFNIQTAAALGSVTGQVTIGSIAQGTGSDSGGGGGQNAGSDSGGGGGQNAGSDSGGGGGQNAGSDSGRQRHSSGGGGGQNAGSDSGGGGGSQYCYSVSITNPLNGKTRTVNVCFDNRSDCEQAQQHDPDSSSGCETR
jgi:hypothetical protein